MAILLMKDLSLKGRLLLALLAVLIVVAVAWYASWEKQEYRAGHRRLAPPVETSPQP